MNDVIRAIKDLPKIRLGNLKPPGASFTNSNLIGADLSYSDLRNVDLTESKLRGAKMANILSNYETLLPEVIFKKSNSKENQQLRTQNSFQRNVTRATKKQCIYSSYKQLKYVPTFYSSGPYKRNTVRINKQSFHRQLQT